MYDVSKIYYLLGFYSHIRFDDDLKNQSEFKQFYINEIVNLPQKSINNLLYILSYMYIESSYCVQNFAPEIETILLD